jgi:hypothetical protein
VRSPGAPDMGSKGKLAAVGALILAVGLGVLWFRPVMAPVRPGTSADFWYAACGVWVGPPRKPVLGRTYPPRDGWFLYYRQDFHGQTLYRVPAEEALADFPRVLRALGRAQPSTLPVPATRGFRRWAEQDPDESDAEGFLAAIHDSWRDYLRERNPGSAENLRDEEAAFAERWERVRRYEWNVWGEFVYLSALVVFAAWPWLRSGGPLRWAVHLGLVPALLFLPYWLGYAAFTFTSAGPSGGVLYPWLIVWFRRLPWTALDTALVSRLPPVLEPYAQTPGPMLSLSGTGGVGPVAALGLGLLIGALAYIGRLALTPPRRSGERGPGA